MSDGSAGVNVNHGSVLTLTPSSDGVAACAWGTGSTTPMSDREPATAVVASLWTVSVAVRSPNALVVDDYGKIGIATDKKKQRDELAAALNLEGTLQIHSAEGSEVVFMLSMTGDYDSPPEILMLNLSHPTLQHLDRSVELRRLGNAWEGSTPPLPDGRYYILVEPEAASWRLTGEISAATRNLTLRGGAE
mgnify:CR=1 FL=1